MPDMLPMSRLQAGSEVQTLGTRLVLMKLDHSNSHIGALSVEKTGRPRLDDRPGFKEAFATILPRLLAKEISQGQAAKALGASVRWRP